MSRIFFRINYGRNEKKRRYTQFKRTGSIIDRLSVGLLYFTVIPYNLISRSWLGVLDTTLCDKVFQWHATGRWFSPGSPVSSTSKTDHHDIAELLLKVALNTINQTNNLISYYNHHHKHILNDFVNVYSISLITQLIFLKIYN